MLDFGAGEFVVVGVVALIAIGPKELPGVLRTIGRSVGKMRRMAGDFQNQFNDAMREMELEEARKKVEEMGKSVSDQVQAATHVDFDAASSGQANTDAAAPHASTDDNSSTVPDLSALSASLPIVEAPSADQLLAQAHSDVLSAPPVSDSVTTAPTPDPLQAGSQPTTTETHGLPPDQAGKGTSHV